MRRVLFTIFLLVSLVGCIAEREYNSDYRQRLVVEGSIEAGRGAIVALSLNTPFDEEYDEDDMKDLVVRWAKVTVECGERSEVLVGRSDKEYPTQYIYTGSDIIGEVGESYTLIVEYSGHTWRATTTIPTPAELGDISITRMRDTLYTITATLPPTASPCMIDCAMGGSSYFAPTMLGVYDTSDRVRRVTVNRPMGNLYVNEYMTLFHVRDTVALKLRTMDSFAYEYWNLWQNNVINSLNPIFPAVDNLPTNISNDAMGIWAGYGSSVKVVSRGDIVE